MSPLDWGASWLIAWGVPARYVLDLWLCLQVAAAWVQAVPHTMLCFPIGPKPA